MSSIALGLNIAHSTKNWARHVQKCILVFMCSTSNSCPILMKLEISRQFFEKYSNIKFHENPSSGSWVVPCGRTDRHDETNSRYSKFCVHVKKGQPSSTIMYRLPYFYAARLPGRNINALWQNFLCSQDAHVCSQPSVFLKR